MANNESDILIYEDKDGITKVNVKFIDEDVWLTQNHIAQIYKTTQENISMHIRNIYKDAELKEVWTNKKFLLVQKERNRQVKLLNRKKILEGKRKISHEEAIEKAEKEFNIYREREMKELKSDFDLLMEEIEKYTV